MKLNKKQIRATQALVSKYFKNAEGKPYHMTPGECEIFMGVLNQDIKWLWMSAPTRYGKSETLALAILFLAFAWHIKIPIVAGSADKARKIMAYIVTHIGDHPDIFRSLVNVKLSEIEKLKVTISKDLLRWSDGGWILVTSVDSRQISKEGEGAVGEGGDVVVLEEAGLIKRKEQFSKIVRMPEGKRGWGKLIMSGNCVEGSVFEDAWNNPLYTKIRVTLEQAIAEGRYTEKEIKEKRSQTTTKDWKRYYLVKFPEAGEFTYFKPKAYDRLPPIDELKIFGATDPALGKKKKGEAESSGSLVGIVVLGQHVKTGQVYEIESIGEHLKPNEIINRIFSLPYTFERFGVEAVQFQAYFLETMSAKSKEDGRYIPFEAIQQNRKKEERIESLEPFINTGQILFKEGSILWQHMQDYPDLEFLDVLDTLEMCFRPLHGSSFDFDFV